MVFFCVIQKIDTKETSKGDYTQKNGESQPSHKSLEDQLVEKAKAYFDSIGGDSSKLSLYPLAGDSDIYDGTYYLMQFSDGNKIYTMLGLKKETSL